ncbi:MAG: LUD domain-containing protein [Thermoguttaceae bacterium]|nr:LUD domain-containing protein [Thermoguttaceae bacterium]
MASREEILSSVKKALSDLKEKPSLPPMPEIWPIRGASSDELADEFEKNLVSVAGEVIRCTDINDAVAKIVETLKTLSDDGNHELGIVNRPLTDLSIAPLAEALPDWKQIFAPENPADADPKKLQTVGASLVAPELLLADTGTAIIFAKSVFERLMCYLSPVCFILAKKDQLRENMPHAWPEMLKKAGPDGAKTGEFVMMTGPSRTADIEKILILGVHGPKKVVVFLLDN